MIRRISNKLHHRNYLLAVSPANYLVALGGTEKFLHDEQAELRKRNVSYIQVYPHESYETYIEDNHGDQFVGVNVDSVPAGIFTITQLGLILQFLTITGTTDAVTIHVHHLKGLSILGIVSLIHTVQARRVRFFLHDYYTICPQFNLLKNDTLFCGGPPVDSEACRECTWGEKRSEQFGMVRTIFNNVHAEFVIPSESAAAIWARSFPEQAQHLRVVPHQIPRETGPIGAERRERLNDPDYRPRIAFVGYEGVNKGSYTWWRVTSEKTFKKRYEWFHLGAASVDIPGVRTVPVSFLDEGPDAMIHALNTHGIDIAFLWSIWPETYSFTLYEAFASCCFVLTNRLSGNIAAQIRDTGRGVVFDDESGLFEFLRDVGGVREAIRRNVHEHSLYRLEFNPQLAIESADDISMEGEQSVDGEVTAFFNGTVTQEWQYLLRRLARESVRTEEGEKREEHSVPTPDTAEDRRVIVDYLRLVGNRYPLLGRMMRRTLFVFRMLSQAMRREGQGHNIR